MKYPTILLIASGVLTTYTQAAGVFANQQLMVNPFMTDNFDGWTPIAPWRNDGSANQVFDINVGGPTGFFVTTQDTFDISTVGAHVSDPDFDTATSRLTDINFNGVFLGNANGMAAGLGLEANFFIELDIVTPAGTYRARSNDVANPWTQPAGNFLTDNAEYTWLGGGFLGDPFADDGVALDQITDLNVGYFMQIASNNDGTGPVFVTLDNASIEYEVTTVAVPEPSTVGLLGGALLLMARRKRTRR